MRSFALALLGSLLGILGSAGCGGGGGGPSCSTNFTACGGDLTGTWTYQEDCNAGSVMVPNCPTATENITTNLSGTITFNADKTYATDLTIGETGSGTIPATCLAGATSCSMLSHSSTNGGLTTKVTCTGDATKSCTCTISENGTVSQTGKYATAGSAVTLTPKGGSAGTPTPYCVKGSELDVSGSVMGATTTANTYSVFTK